MRGTPLTAKTGIGRGEGKGRVNLSWYLSTEERKEAKRGEKDDGPCDEAKYAEAYTEAWEK